MDLSSLLQIHPKALELKLLLITPERHIFCMSSSVEIESLHYILNFNNISMIIFMKHVFDVKYNGNRMILYGETEAEMMVQSLRKYLGSQKYNVLYNTVSQENNICLYLRKDSGHCKKLISFLKTNDKGVLQKRVFKFKMIPYKSSLNTPFIFCLENNGISRKPLVKRERNAAGILEHISMDDCDLIKTKKYKPVEKLSELVYSLCGKIVFQWVDGHYDTITNDDNTLLQYTPLCLKALYYKLSIRKTELFIQGSVLFYDINFKLDMLEGEALMNFCFQLTVGDFLYKLMWCQSYNPALAS